MNSRLGGNTWVRGPPARILPGEEKYDDDREGNIHPLSNQV